MYSVYAVCLSSVSVWEHTFLHKYGNYVDMYRGVREPPSPYGQIGLETIGTLFS